MKGSTQSVDVPAGRLFLAGALGVSASVAVILALSVYAPFGDGVVLLLGAAPLLLAFLWGVRSALRASHGSTAGGGSDVHDRPARTARAGPAFVALQMLFWLGGSLALGWAFFDSLVIGGLIVVLEAISLAVLVALARSGRLGQE